MTTPGSYYPPTGFYFSVTFERMSLAVEDFRFQSISGLSSEITTENYREGGQNQFQYTLPLRAQYSDLVLKRGLLVPKTISRTGQPSDIQQWCHKTIQSILVEPVDLIIMLLNSAGIPLMTWNVVHAWPKKWSVSDFNAQENAIVIETMEFAYHYFKVI